MKNCKFCKQPLPEGFVKKIGRPITIDHEKIKALRIKGLSIQEIADETGASYRSVSRTISIMCTKPVSNGL